MATKLSLALSLLLLLAGINGAFASVGTSAVDGVVLEAQDSSSKKAFFEDHDSDALLASQADVPSTHQQDYSLPALEPVTLKTIHHAHIRAPPFSSFSPTSIL